MATSGNFWARRKAAVQAEEQAEAAAAQAAIDAAEAQTITADQQGKTDTQLLQELGLPDPETLVQGDDFSAFMGRAVPEHLRRRALRKLWVSNPVLANLDGLVDHGEDYTDAATVIPGMQTAYQVGKGMMQHVIALAEKQAAEKQAAETEVDVAVEPVLQEELVVEEDEADETIMADLDVPPPVDGEVQEVTRPRRHMRFEFSS